jgi:hypothetical protein
MTSATITPAVAPNLCFFTVATAEPLVVRTEPCATGVSVATAALDRPDPITGGRTSRLSEAFRHDWNCFGTQGRTVARVRFAFRPLQVGSYFGCTLIAQVAIFLQRLVDDAFQLSGNVRVQAHCRCGLGLRIALKISALPSCGGNQQVNENGPSRSKPTGSRRLPDRPFELPCNTNRLAPSGFVLRLPLLGQKWPPNRVASRQPYRSSSRDGAW